MNKEDEVFLFPDLEKKQNQEKNEFSTNLESKKQTISQKADEFYTKEIEVFETNKTLDGASQPLTLEQDSQTKIDDSLLIQIPDVLKLSAQEKQLYMNNTKGREPVVAESSEQKEQLDKMAKVNFSDEVSFGQVLKNARVEANLSYEEIYQSTRIRVQHIKSLEDENFMEFSSPVYLKAYLRKLCTLYNLSFDEVSHKYNLLTEGKRNKTLSINKPNKVNTSEKKTDSLLNSSLFSKRNLIIGGCSLVLVLFISFFSVGKELPLLPQLDLKPFLEEYSLPDYTFKIPLEKNN